MRLQISIDHENHPTMNFPTSPASGLTNNSITLRYDVQEQDLATVRAIVAKPLDIFLPLPRLMDARLDTRVTARSPVRPAVSTSSGLPCIAMRSDTGWGSGSCLSLKNSSLPKTGPAFTWKHPVVNTICRHGSFMIVAVTSRLRNFQNSMVPKILK